MNRRKTFKKRKRATKKGTGMLLLTRPGEIIATKARGIFRSSYKFKVAGEIAAAASQVAVCKLNSCVTPFQTIPVMTGVSNVTGFDGVNDDSTGFDTYVGDVGQLYNRARVYKSNIKVKCMGGLLGTAYSLCVVPIKAGATPSTYKQISNLPYSKELKDFATIYAPASLSHSMTVAKIAGVPNSVVMNDPEYVGFDATEDPTEQYSWYVCWQTADGTTPAGGIAFEIEIDHYVRFEQPNTQDVIA